MKQSLVFATNNAHKIEEVRAQLGEHYSFRSLKDIGCTEEISETGDTLEANARQKSMHVWENYGEACFSEDTGLEVYALGGLPGVHTAHYAGPARDAEANNLKLLSALGDRRDRLACFRTIISLVIDGQEQSFEGKCEGRIATSPTGRGGFGYDPIFVPTSGDGRSFLQMGQEEKSRISHRGLAMKRLLKYLRAIRQQ